MVDVVIIDGYTDEPAGLGVPPYLDAIQRYVAGAIWYERPEWQVEYFTIDQIRENPRLLRTANKAKIVVFIAGTAVPGKYLGGTPISYEELIRYSRLIREPIKVLGGPAARFGFGVEGGRCAIPKDALKEVFDVIAYGDVEAVLLDLLREKLSVERVNNYVTLPRSSPILNEIARRGAHIVIKHPCYPERLIVEIETYRGCPKAYFGRPCSFCIERFYGKPDYRPLNGILKEIEELYRLGVRRIRLGRQPDLYAYQAIGVGETEFPKPNVEAIAKLFRGIRRVAPNLRTLHIDNVNPGTVYHWKEEARKITKIIVEYHTPGDVAAMGLESADPEVIRRNNLKVLPEEAMEAIRIINEIGARRGWNGLPHLLPGINFVYGLRGETPRTYELNLEFMKRVYNEGLMVRRINIRQVMAFPGTEMWEVGDSIIRKHKRIFHIYKERMRKEVDLPMLRRVIPQMTVLREAYTEAYNTKKRLTYARQVGSYPILIAIPMKLPLYKEMNFIIVDHGYRSVTGLPHPIPVNKLNYKLLKLIPSLGEKLVAKLMKNRPLRSIKDALRIGIPYEIAKEFSFE
ncbi:MAG: radical SAM protein [Thermoprotei archaeon]|nr:MAG: radical SAM protein [Thermoprotei archaeon]